MLKTLLSFFRIPNLALIAALMWIVRHFVLANAFQTNQIPYELSSWQFTLFNFDVCLVALIGYWINDWHDREIDRINRPNRFLVKYAVSSRQFSIGLATAICFGFGITIWIGIQTFKTHLIWIYPTIVFVLFAYASKLKLSGFWGNLLVSFLIGLIPWVVLLSEISSLTLLKLQDPSTFFDIVVELTLFSVLILIANTGREIAKDAEDAIGDAAFGSKSVPVIYGLNFTKRTLIILWISLVFVQLIMLHIITNDGFMVLSALAILLAAIFSIARITKATKPIDFGEISGHLKIVMAIGLIQMILLSI